MTPLKWAYSLLLAALALMQTPVLCAGEQPRAPDLELNYLVLHIIDWRQTRHIARHPDRFREYNPTIGRHPNKYWVDAYFLLSGAGYVAVNRYLDPDTRFWWQVSMFAIKAAVVLNNYHEGIDAENGAGRILITFTF